MLASQEHSLWIEDFWSKLGGNKNLGYKASQKKKMRELLRLSQVVIYYERPVNKSRIRKTFDCIKFSRHSLNSHPKCFVCFEPAQARHHIILIKNGGINSKRNLVSLCNPCHARIHPWIRGV